MTGTYEISFDKSGFGIAIITLTDKSGREIAQLEFAPGDTTTYLQPGNDFDNMADSAQVLAALIGK